MDPCNQKAKLSTTEAPGPLSSIHIEVTFLQDFSQVLLHSSEKQHACHSPIFIH